MFKFIKYIKLINFLHNQIIKEMKKIERKFNSNDFQPKRFGLKFSPPQISKINKGK